MSKKLEALIENLSTTQAAKLMTVANELSRHAREAFGVDVPLDDIATLIQVKNAVFGDADLDDMDVSNALYNLRQHSEAVRAHLANTEGLEAAKKGGADPKAAELDADTLMEVRNPHLRMALARKHGIGKPLPVVERPGRPKQPDAVRQYESAAETINDAIRRLNEARGIK